MDPTAISFVLVLTTSAWMAYDASRLGYERRDLLGSTVLRPLGWFWAGMLIWILAFPFYLWKRSDMRDAGQRRRQAVRTVAAAGLLPPGYDAPPAAGPVADLVAMRASGLIDETEFLTKVEAIADDPDAARASRTGARPRRRGESRRSRPDAGALGGRA